MATDRLERARKSASKRNKRLLRIAAAVITGTVIGYVCPLLPEDWQGYCHFAAKVIGFFVGSP